MPKLPGDVIPQAVRILVADDNATISALVTDILRAEGYDVDVARTGSAAWAKLTSTRYDVVLCDIVLPELDGLSLYRRLRGCQADSRPRVVLVSGYEQQEVEQILEETGVAFLGKPFRVEDLIAVIREVLAPLSQL
jgi:CheY-like chemotaxis protein